MAKYFIVYNNISNKDVKCEVVKRPVKPSAEIEYEEKPVPGGKILYIEKYYKDIEIPISFNFVSKPHDWERDFRKIKRWLRSKGEILKFSDDLETLYKVNKVKIDTPERTLKRLGKFIVTFTCSPYVYFQDGKEERELTNYLYNDEIIAQPIYHIVGEGLLTLTINEKQIQINVGQEVIVNTELGLCLKNGVTSNVDLKGNYKDLYLQEGDNNFSWNGNFTIYITPNWRCLS